MTIPPLALRLLPYLAVAAAIYVGLVLLAFLFQRRLVYLPFPRRVPPIESAFAQGRELSARTSDGIPIAAWWIPSRSTPSQATVMVMNGNAGNRSHRAPLAAALRELGCDVVLFDYRGYGENPGRPSEEGLLEDARAVRRLLVEDEEVDPARLFYFGESLGAAVALALAIEETPAALVLRSPFTSLVDAGRHHYPFLPVSLLLRDRFPSIERVGVLGAPLLVIAGDRDRVVPEPMSRRLFEAAPEPKRYLLLEGTDHNDFELLAGERLVSAVEELIAIAARK